MLLSYKSFSGLCHGVAAELAGRAAVLDGEIVYLDNDGRRSFIHYFGAAGLSDSLHSRLASEFAIPTGHGY